VSSKDGGQGFGQFIQPLFYPDMSFPLNDRVPVKSETDASFNSAEPEMSISSISSQNDMNKYSRNCLVNAKEKC
jgi:hypothetical protein